MNYILKNVIPLITGLGLVVFLSVVTAACSSKASPSTSSILHYTTPTTTVTSPSPQTSQPSQFQRRGASGTIAAINPKSTI